MADDLTGTVPMKDLIAAVVAQSKLHLIDALDTVGQDQAVNDDEKRNNLLNVVLTCHHLLKKCLVILDWAAEGVPGILQARRGVEALSQQSDSFVSAADELWRLHMEINNSNTRSSEYDITAAVDILSTGMYNELPYVMTGMTPAAMESRSKDISSVFCRLEMGLRYMLIREEIPPGIRVAPLRSADGSGVGMLEVSSHNVYYVLLDVVPRSNKGESESNSNMLDWRILDLRVMIADYRDHQICAALSPSPELSSWYGPLMRGRKVVDELSLRMSLSVTPIQTMCEYLHCVCIKYSLLTLYDQATEVHRKRWSQTFSIPSNPLDGDCLKVRYWETDGNSNEFTIKGLGMLGCLTATHNGNLSSVAVDIDPCQINFENVLLSLLSSDAKSRLQRFVDMLDTECSSDPLLNRQCRVSARLVDTNSSTFVAVEMQSLFLSEVEFSSTNIVVNIGVCYRTGRFEIRSPDYHRSIHERGLSIFEMNINTKGCSYLPALLRLRRSYALDMIGFLASSYFMLESVRDLGPTTFAPHLNDVEAVYIKFHFDYRIYLRMILRDNYPTEFVIVSLSNVGDLQCESLPSDLCDTPLFKKWLMPSELIVFPSPYDVASDLKELLKICWPVARLKSMEQMLIRSSCRYKVLGDSIFVDPECIECDQSERVLRCRLQPLSPVDFNVSIGTVDLLQCVGFFVVVEFSSDPLSSFSKAELRHFQSRCQYIEAHHFKFVYDKSSNTWSHFISDFRSLVSVFAILCGIFIFQQKSGRKDFVKILTLTPSTLTIDIGGWNNIVLHYDNGYVSVSMCYMNTTLSPWIELAINGFPDLCQGAVMILDELHRLSTVSECIHKVFFTQSFQGIRDWSCYMNCDGGIIIGFSDFYCINIDCHDDVVRIDSVRRVNPLKSSVELLGLLATVRRRQELRFPSLSLLPMMESSGNTIHCTSIEVGMFAFQLLSNFFVGQEIILALPAVIDGALIESGTHRIALPSPTGSAIMLHDYCDVVLIFDRNQTHISVTEAQTLSSIFSNFVINPFEKIVMEWQILASRVASFATLLCLPIPLLQLFTSILPDITNPSSSVIGSNHALLVLAAPYAHSPFIIAKNAPCIICSSEATISDVLFFIEVISPDGMVSITLPLRLSFDSATSSVALCLWRVGDHSLSQNGVLLNEDLKRMSIDSKNILDSGIDKLRNTYSIDFLKKISGYRLS